MRQEWVGKRKSMRQTVLIRAQVQFLDNTPSRECTIIDISKGGARLETDDLAALPETFDIFIPARNETRYARITRREESFVCVEFLRSRGDDTKLMDELIRRLNSLEEMAGAEGKLPKRASPKVTALEARLAALETELAAVRGIAEAAADVPAQAPAAAPDRLPEIQSLHDSLALLADRLEKAQGTPQVAPEALALLNARVDSLCNRPEPASVQPQMDDLRQQMADLCAVVAKASQPDDRATRLEAELREELAGLHRKLAASWPAESASPTVTPADLQVLACRLDELAARPEPASHAPQIIDLQHQIDTLGDAVANAARPDDTMAAAMGRLQQDITDLRADMEHLRKLAAAMQMPSDTLPAPPQAPDLAEDGANLRKSVQTLILLVSQSLARSRAAA